MSRTGIIALAAAVFVNAASASAALPPLPTVPASATLAIASPRLDAFMADLRALSASVGHYAPIVRPETLAHDVAPGLPDLLDSTVLATTGFAIDAPASLYVNGGVLCFTAGIRSESVLTKTLDAWFAFRSLKAQKRRGGWVAGASGGEARVYYRLVGKQATLCGFAAGMHAFPVEFAAGQQRAHSDLPAAWAALTPGNHVLLAGSGQRGLVAELKIGSNGLEMHGRWRMPEALSVTPLERLPRNSDNIAWIDAQFPILATPESRPAVERAARRTLEKVCPSCDKSAGQKLANSLLGPFSARIESIDLRKLERRQTFGDVLDALRFQVLFPLKEGVPLRTDGTPPGLAIDRFVSAGTPTLFFANGFARPQPASHGDAAGPPLEGAIDLHRAFTTLSRYDLGDLASGDGAAAFAVARMEAGSFLQHSGPITFSGTLAKPGEIAVEARWPIDPGP